MATLTQRRWVHPEYQISPLPIQRRAKVEAPKQKRSIFCPFVCVTLVTLSAISSAVVTTLRNTRSDISVAAYAKAKLINGFSFSDDRVLRAEVEKKRKITSQVHYVQDIIRTAIQNPVEAKRIAQSIVSESQRANYDPLFVAAVIKSESRFNNKAVSPVGAHGLMQILPETAQYIIAHSAKRPSGSRQLQDPRYNIQLGIAYLKELEQTFKGNREHALIAYNWGPGNLIRALREKTHIPTSTIKYARTILSTHKHWSNDLVLRAQEFKYRPADGVA